MPFEGSEISGEGTVRRTFMDGPVTRLKLVSILETVSFLGLLLKMFVGSEAGVSAVGMLHGLLFLAYALLVLVDRAELEWSSMFVALSIVTGPLGAIFVLDRLRREHPGGADEMT
jgi:integral membrane protein